MTSDSPQPDPPQDEDRRRGRNRRQAAERRITPAERRTGIDRRSGLDRRRGPGIRRSTVRRSAEEGEMKDDQFEFLMAIEEYKRVNQKPFPSWTEILEIAKHLGYRKVAPRGESINKIEES